MEEILQETLTAEDVEVVDIQFRPGQKVYYFDPAGHELQPGDHVIIDTARGAEYGIVAAGNHRIPAKDIVPPLRCVLRQATEQDERVVE
jgi:cell fate regulator YaaT (PSP1 superfamily)